MPRYRGRHRAPSTAGRTAARIALSAGVATAPLTIVGEASAASPAGVAEAIRLCESGDRNIEHGGDPGGVSTASGYYQFVNGTWRIFGGTDFAPRAINATKAEQTIVFERAFARNGLADWEASRRCWSPQLGRHASGQPAPRHAVTTPARHAADTYVVRSGDTLSSIAAAHHTTWPRLWAANRATIPNPNRIFPDERIHL